MQNFYSEQRLKAVEQMLRKLGKQIAEQVRKRRMAAVAPDQFMVTLASACIFPFAARPGLTVALALDAKGFDALLERRRKELPAFLKRALRP